MNIMRILLGAQFLRLIYEGKETDHLIKNGGASSFKKSIPRKEVALNIEWLRGSRPNPISIGIIVMLLVASVAWEWTPLIYFFNFPTDIETILCLSIMPITGVYALFIPYGLGRGYTWGLKLIIYFYIFNIILTLISFLMITVQPTDFQKTMRKSIFFSLQLLFIFLSRYTINSDSFYRIITFLRTLRFNLAAQKQYNIMQK